MFEKRSDLIKFLTVADTGKILWAADRLSITQPALSRAIARLEIQFGGQLFERIPTGVRLTELGTMVVGLARDILREMEHAETKVHDIVSGHTGRLRVTAVPTWMHAVLPEAIVRFHARHPGIELKLRTANASEGIGRLTDGESDLHCGGVDAHDPLPPFLRCQAFLKVASGIVAHKDHPLHKAGPTLPDLADYPWIDYDGPPPQSVANGNGRPSVTKILDDLYQATNRRVQTVIRAGAVGLFLLGSGPYLSWLPLPFIASIQDLHLKPLEVELGHYRYRTGIVWRRSSEGLTSFRSLREIVKEVAAERAV